MAEASEVNSLFSRRCERRFGDARKFAELAAAICAAAGTDEDPESNQEAQALRRDFWTLWRDLDQLLTPAIRDDLQALLDHLTANSTLYTEGLYRWLSLVEELSLTAEHEYGPKTGPTKLAQVEGAIYFLFRDVVSSIRLPSFPPTLNPLIVQVGARFAVELIVAIDNNDDQSMRLWRDETFEPPSLQKKAIQTVRKPLSFFERLFTWVLEFFVGLYFKPPKLNPTVQAKVDEIIGREKERPLSVRRMILNVVDFLQWLGRNRAAFDGSVRVLTSALKVAARLQAGDRHERLALVREAVLLYFADLGYEGMYFRAGARVILDQVLDPIVRIFEKRQVIAFPGH